MYINIFIYIYIYEYTYVLMYIHTYIPTHTHTHTQAAIVEDVLPGFYHPPLVGVNTDTNVCIQIYS